MGPSEQDHEEIPGQSSRGEGQIVNKWCRNQLIVAVVGRKFRWALSRPWAGSIGRVYSSVTSLLQNSCFILGENAGTFYLLHKFLFANFEFIFAIRGPKFARRGVEKYNEHGSK